MANTQITFFNQQTDKKSENTQTLVTMIAQRYSQGKRMLIVCANDQQMLELDETLWQLEPDRILAHAMISEPVSDKAPIVLATQAPTTSQRFSCWFNLHQNPILPIPRTQEIVEFVPVEENAKQSARERYKSYCQAGIKPQFNNSLD